MKTTTRIAFILAVAASIVLSISIYVLDIVKQPQLSRSFMWYAPAYASLTESLELESNSPTLLGDTTLFTATVQGTYQGIRWDFGDSSPMTVTYPLSDTHATITTTHIYMQTGVYTATAVMLDIYNTPITHTTHVTRVVIVPGLTVMTDKQRMPADGTSTLPITATLQDANGTPISAHTVTFSASLGTLVSDTLKSNEQGIVTTTLTAPNQPGLATIKVQAGLATHTITVTFEQMIQKHEILLPFISNVTAIPTQIDIEQKGELSSIRLGETHATTISATVLDTLKRPLEDQVVTFTTTLGTMTPVTETIDVPPTQDEPHLSSNTSLTATTNVQGVASVQLIPGEQYGSATIVAQAGDVQDSIAIEFLIRLCNDKENANDSILDLPLPPVLDSINSICEGSLDDDPPNEDDYYQLQVTEKTKEFHIELSNIPEGADYDLFLYNDSALSPISVSQNEGSSNENIRINLSPGTYYVDVYMYMKSPTQNKYRLQVNEQDVALSQQTTTLLETIGTNGDKINKHVTQEQYYATQEIYNADIPSFNKRQRNLRD